jgi:hypothetical protein
MSEEVKPPSGEEVTTPAPVEELAETPEAAIPEAETVGPSLESLQAEMEQLRKDAKEAEERGRRKGQGDLESAAARAREEGRAAEAQRAIFGQLQALYTAGQQGDTEANERFQKAIADKRYADIWNAGLEPAGEEIVTKAKTEGQVDLIRTTRGRLLAHEKVQALGEEKLNEIEKNSATWPDFFVNVGVALGERFAAEGLEGQRAEMKKALRAEILEEQRHTAGEVVELRGGGTGTLPTIEQIGKMSVEKVQELERSGDLDKALARGK